MDHVAQLPDAFYVAIGLMVVGNLGVLITLLTLIFKAGMFVSDTRAGIESAKSYGIRAHKRIDVLESKKREG